MLGSTLLLAVSLAALQTDTGMPDAVREHFDKHIVGEWTTETTWGDVVTCGETKAQWAEGGQTVVSQWTGEKSAGGGKAFVASVLGWDAETKGIIEYAVASNGDHWRYQWTGISDQEWTGRGTGIFNGKEWSADATIQWLTDGSRYEDTSEGKPFVLVARRKPSAVTQPAGILTVPELVLKQFQYLVGDWIAEGTTSDGRTLNATLTFRWLPGNKAVMFDSDWKAGELQTKGSGIFGWESADQKVHTSEFWEAGGYNHRHYTVVSDHRWEGYQFSGINDKGQRLTQRVTFEAEDPNEFIFVASDRIVDGRPEMGESKITFRRK